MALLVFAVVVRNKLRYRKDAVGALVALVLVLGVLFYVINYGKSYNQAIISVPNTYVMSGPSAGAEVIEVVKKGHRVKVKNTTDVWTEVIWNDDVAYIKANKLRRLEPVQ